MQVGDLVRAPHWEDNQTGIVVSTKRLNPDKTGVVKVLGSFGWELDQLARDLEVINHANE